MGIGGNIFNRIFKKKKNNTQHYYDTDVWGIIAERYKDSIKDGITLYGEIVGQLPSGTWIQKNYDYGMPQNYCDLFVYRITYTSPSGDVYEFTTPQMKRYCDSHGLKTVPVFFSGRAKDLVHNLFKKKDVDNEFWRKKFLNFLIETYTEKDCYMCKNKVPEEGIVIVKEQDVFEPYKLKSFNFLKRESEELDKGEENMDDN